MIIGYVCKNINRILLVAIFCIAPRGLLFCSATKKSSHDKIYTKRAHTYLVEFDKLGWPKVYIFNEKSNEKKPLNIKSSANAKLSQEKIDQALEAASHMGTFTMSNRFIIYPNGVVTLRTNPVLILRKPR